MSTKFFRGLDLVAGIGHSGDGELADRQHDSTRANDDLIQENDLSQGSRSICAVRQTPGAGTIRKR